MSHTILIVEDQQVLREIMAEYLSDEGYDVLEAPDGRRALALFAEHNVDLIILDIMLPELDGWSVCRRIRKTSNVPILMLTARSDEDDTLLGFELGADDYVVKPCSPPILLARTKRLLHNRVPTNRSSKHRPIRTGPTAGGPGPVRQTLAAGGITIDTLSRTVTLGDEPCRLTHTEFELLAYLINNKGIVVTREQLITNVWGYDFSGDDRTLNSHMRNLRSKLGAYANRIVTVIRSGYKFEEHP